MEDETADDLAEEISAEAEAADETLIEAHVRCTKQNARIAEKTAKSRLNRHKVSQYDAKTALENLETRFTR